MREGVLSAAAEVDLPDHHAELLVQRVLGVVADDGAGGLVKRRAGIHRHGDQVQRIRQPLRNRTQTGQGPFAEPQVRREKPHRKTDHQITHQSQQREEPHHQPGPQPQRDRPHQAPHHTDHQVLVRRILVRVPQGQKQFEDVTLEARHVQPQHHVVDGNQERTHECTLEEGIAPDVVHLDPKRGGILRLNGRAKQRRDEEKHRREDQHVHDDDQNHVVCSDAAA